MLDMRFRLPDLMAARGIGNAYQLAKRTNGVMNHTTAQRLVAAGHDLKRIDMTTLDVLCDALKVDPGELFERDKAKRR